MRFWYRHARLVKILFYTFLVILLIVLFIQKTITPAFLSLAETEAVRIANRAINEAVDQEIEGIKYEDLISYQVNQEGNIVMMQPNIREVNRFSSNISLNVQQKLEQITNVDILIPAGKILGFELLAGMGPNIKVKIVPSGLTHPPTILDSFEAAGINQTRHKIYLQMNVKLKLIVPFTQKVTTVNADVPVIEVTILGRVPEIYVGLNGDQLSGILNNRN